MANDPVPLLHALAALSSDADYEAAYAAVTATERGRWLLAEYASRNRQADTRMLLGALARVEAAIRAELPPQIPGAVCRDLMELAAAVERIEAMLSGGWLPDTGGAALERIHDVAFALREREVDATLCDAVENAVREIGSVVAQSEAALEGARRAAALLQDIKGRLDAMIAVAFTGAPPPTDGEGTRSFEAPRDAVGRVHGVGEVVRDAQRFSPAALSAAEVREDEDLALSIGVLAASLSEAADAAEPVTGREREAVASHAGGAAIAAADVAAAPAEAEPAATSAAEVAAAREHEHPEDAGGMAGAESAILSKVAFLVERLAHAAPPGDDPPTKHPPSVASRQPLAGRMSGEQTEPEASEPLRSDQSSSKDPARGTVGPMPSSGQGAGSPPHAAPSEAESALGPYDDPGDLFEPLPCLGPPLAPAVAATVAAGAGQSSTESEKDGGRMPDEWASSGSGEQPVVSAPREPTAAAEPSAAQKPASDPLAPMRALSAEELIALFS